MTRCHKHLFEKASRAFAAEYASLDGELAAVHHGTKAMSVFEWSQRDLEAGSGTEFAHLIRKSLALGLSVMSRPVELIEKNEGEMFRAYVCRNGELWRVPAYHLLVSLIGIENGPAWTDELEWFQCCLLGYSDEQRERWFFSRKRLGLGRFGRPLYVILSHKQRSAIGTTGDRCLPHELTDETLTLVLVRGNVVPISDAEKHLLVASLTLARFWVSQALYDLVMSDDVFDDRGMLEKDFQVTSVAEFNRNIIDQIEFYEDGWPCEE